MPLRDPNAVAFAPYWSRNSQLAQADINNLMYNNMMGQSNQATLNYQNPRRVARRPSRPAASSGDRLANARRIEAARRGGVVPSYPTIQQSAPVQGTPSQLANTYQQQIDAANAANEDRYADILQGYRDREEAARSQSALAGDQQYREESARVRNDLIGRGLANSSLLGKGLFDAYERQAQNQLNVDLQTSGDRLAFMERRNDVGPDYSQMLQLAQLQGQTQAFQNQDMQGLLGQIGSAVDQRIGAGNQPSYGGQSRAQAAAQMNYALQGVAPFAMQGTGYRVPNFVGLGVGGGYPMQQQVRPGNYFAGYAGPQQQQQGMSDLEMRRRRAELIRSMRAPTGSRRNDRVGPAAPAYVMGGTPRPSRDTVEMEPFPTTPVGAAGYPTNGGRSIPTTKPNAIAPSRPWATNSTTPNYTQQPVPRRM